MGTPVKLGGDATLQQDMGVFDYPALEELDPSLGELVMDGFSQEKRMAHTYAACWSGLAAFIQNAQGTPTVEQHAACSRHQSVLDILR